jgi:hypothetical protein
MRMYFANHTLMMTVPMVRVSHAGMNMAWTFLDRSEGPQVRAAKPTMMTVIKMSRFGDDLPPVDVSCP